MEKRFTKIVKNPKTGRTKTVKYGQAGKAKDGGDRIRPGTAKGDAYCARSAKIKGDWKYVERCIKNGVYTEKELQHTLRYYVCNTGSKIMKINKSDGREINIEAGKWLQQIYINHIDDMDFDEYEINYKYYLENIKKEIEGLEPNVNQLSLF